MVLTISCRRAGCDLVHNDWKPPYPPHESEDPQVLDRGHVVISQVEAKAILRMRFKTAQRMLGNQFGGVTGFIGKQTLATNPDPHAINVGMVIHITTDIAFEDLKAMVDGIEDGSITQVPLTKHGSVVALTLRAWQKSTPQGTSHDADWPERPH